MGGIAFAAEFFGHDGGDSGDADDGLEVAVAGESVDGFGESDQDGSDDFHFAEVLHELVADVSGVEGGEDEDVGGIFEGAEGEVMEVGFGVDGDVYAHLAVDHQVRAHLFGDLCGFLNLDGLAVSGASEVRERQHGDARCDAKLSDQVGCCDSDVGELFGVGVDIDGGIGKEAGFAFFIEDHVHTAGDGVALGEADDLEGGFDDLGVVVSDSTDTSVCVTAFDHHHGVAQGVLELLSCAATGDAFAFAQADVSVDVVCGDAAFFAGVDDLVAIRGEVEAEVLGVLEDVLLVAEQHGVGDAFVDHDVASAQDRGMIAFGEDDAHLSFLGVSLPNKALNHLACWVDQSFEALLIGFQIVEGFACDTAVHGGLGDGGSDAVQHARVKGFGDDVVAAKLQALFVVGL